jgi:AbiV family abortive infection protein
MARHGGGSVRIDPVQQFVRAGLAERNRSTRHGRLQPDPIKNPSYEVLSKACLFNSLTLFRSSELLASEGEYGQSTSLLILSLEELSKATLFQWVSWGFLSTNPEDRGKRAYLEPAVLRCHQCKQRHIYLVQMSPRVLENLVDVPALEATFEALYKDPSAKIDIDLSARARERLAEIDAGLRAREEKVIDIAKSLVEMDLLERLKWLGLYVEGDSTLMQAPWLITRDVHKTIRDRYRSMLRTIFPLLTAELPSEAMESMRRMMVAFSSTLKEPIECEHPAGKRYRGKLKITKWPSDAASVGPPNAGPSVPPPS